MFGASLHKEKLMSEAELHTNHLTEEEIKKLREEFKKK